MGGGHRPRHAFLVVAHAVSGRGLLTATALSVEALGRVVPGLDIGHGRDRSRRGRSRSFDRYRSRRERARFPCLSGGAARSFAIARSPESLA